MNTNAEPDAVKGRDDEPMPLRRVLEIGREVANDRDALYRTLVSTRDPGLDPVIVALWATTAADAILADGFRRQTASVSEGPSPRPVGLVAHQGVAGTCRYCHGPVHWDDGHTVSGRDGSWHNRCQFQEELRGLVERQRDAAQATADRETANANRWARMNAPLIEALCKIAAWGRPDNLPGEPWSEGIARAALGAASDSAKDKETGNGILTLREAREMVQRQAAAADQRRQEAYDSDLGSSEDENALAMMADRLSAAEAQGEAMRGALEEIEGVTNFGCTQCGDAFGIARRALEGAKGI